MFVFVSSTPCRQCGSYSFQRTLGEEARCLSCSTPRGAPLRFVAPGRHRKDRRRQPKNTRELSV